MKIYKLLSFFIFAAVFLFFGIVTVEATFNPYRPLCVGIDGKFSANSTWTGGTIQVGCVGDNGLATNDPSQRCTGEVQTVRPGERFRLTKCSCWGSNKGCLKIGKELTLNPLDSNQHKTITVVKRIDEMPAFINNSCRITKTGDMCGSNGQHITGNIKITCAVPTPTPRPSATPTPKPSVTPTPRPSTTPGPSECPGPEKVTNVKITCPNCFSSEEQ